MRFSFVRKSDNSKTGPMPVVYASRDTCPEDCPHYRTSCYAEAGWHTRMVWDRTDREGATLDEVCERVAALPENTIWRYAISGDLPGKGVKIDPVALGRIVWANRGRRGFTYSHKKSADAIEWAGHATRWGFTVNLSADDAGEADELAAHGLPVVCIVPQDTPQHTRTPGGRHIIVCPAQTREFMTCAVCQLCQKADRASIIGFRAHGAKAALADERARRVIPIQKVAA